MTSINFKMIGLTQSEIESVGSGLEPAIFGIRDLPAREAGALLIRPPRLVSLEYIMRNVHSITTTYSMITLYNIITSYTIRTVYNITTVHNDRVNIA